MARASFCGDQIMPLRQLLAAQMGFNKGLLDADVLLLAPPLLRTLVCRALIMSI